MNNYSLFTRSDTRLPSHHNKEEQVFIQKENERIDKWRKMDKHWEKHYGSEKVRYAITYYYSLPSSRYNILTRHFPVIRLVQQFSTSNLIMYRSNF